MMKDVLRNMDASIFAEVGLVIFFIVFVSVVIWALRRSRKEVNHWANLPNDEPLAQAKPKACACANCGNRGKCGGNRHATTTPATHA